jgi:riboflavin synthase alpha subunit
MTEKKRTYYTLKDKILKVKNMKKAEHDVFINKGSAGVDGVSVKELLA